MRSVVLPASACEAIIKMLQSAQDQSSAMEILSACESTQLANNPHEDQAVQMACNTSGKVKQRLVKMSPELDENLKTFCSTHGINVSVLLRTLVYEALNSGRAYRIAAKIVGRKGNYE